MSVDTVNRENKAKQDIRWDSLIQDAKEQIAEAKQRIKKLTDSIAFFKKQRRADLTTRN
jgi:hypothetical protein